MRKFQSNLLHHATPEQVDSIAASCAKMGPGGQWVLPEWWLLFKTTAKREPPKRVRPYNPETVNLQEAP